MTKIASFLQQPPGVQRALLHAWWLLLTTRLRLGLLPYATLHRWSEQPATRNPPAPLPLRTLVWCLEITSGYVPKTTCLVKALAGRRLFTQHGHPTELRIGVAREAKGIAAHAWLERHDAVILGAVENLDRYVPLEQEVGWN